MGYKYGTNIVELQQLSMLDNMLEISMSQAILYVLLILVTYLLFRYNIPISNNTEWNEHGYILQRLIACGIVIMIITEVFIDNTHKIEELDSEITNYEYKDDMYILEFDDTKLGFVSPENKDTNKILQSLKDSKTHITLDDLTENDKKTKALLKQNDDIFTIPKHSTLSIYPLFPK